ncbi:MAG: hypothetical protein E2584_03505, partial [Microbacterium sp.]|nr:hypothetical protein [Microbacterium sp.]
PSSARCAAESARCAWVWSSDWHNRLVGEIDPAEVGIWTPRHARPGTRTPVTRRPVAEGAH